MNFTLQQPVHLQRSTALVARTFDSGFSRSQDSFNGISIASDGKVYYVLSSGSIDEGGRMYVYDPVADTVTFIADLTDVCGEKGSGAVPQGKSHVKFHERKGKLYFATTVGYYQLIDGRERLPVSVPEGYGLYPGGHILSYDLQSGKFEDLALIPGGEGIVSMTMDRDRGHLYGISWPKGHFIHYDVDAAALYHHDQISANGEGGTPGLDFRSLCRSLVVDPRDGTVYFSTSEGDIRSFNPQVQQIHTVADADLRLDYLGKYDPTRPGSMGFNWRKVFWYPGSDEAYAVHGNSGYLLKFNPQHPAIELVRRITSEPSKKSGMFDQFSYGYLGFQLGPDGETIYYLTGGPIYENGRRVKGEAEIGKGASKGAENLHLVTYHIPAGRYTDHGPIFFPNGDRPSYVNSIAVAANGYIYALARIANEGETRTDLIRLADPLKENLAIEQ